jgi:hypothetical protein
MGMNPFESTLVSALRDEAQEMAMSTDLNEGRDVLDNRLDDVDRGRRRWHVAGGLAAAAAAIGVIAFLAVGRPTAAPPANPTPTPSSLSNHYSSSQFALPFAMDLPAWITDNPGTRRNDTPAYTIWVHCPDDSNCVGLTVTRYTNLPDKSGFAGSPMSSYTSYLAYLEDLANGGSIAITGKSETTIDGLPATSFTIEAGGDAPKGAMGCSSGGECDDFLGSGHYVVVDLGEGAPLSIWSRTGNRPDWVAQMDAVLPSFRLLKGEAFSTTQFEVPFDATLPPWLSEVSHSRSERAGHISVRGTYCTSDCSDADSIDVNFLLPETAGGQPGNPASVPVGTVAQYAAYLDSAEAKGWLGLYSQPVKVDGLVGRMYTITPRVDVVGGMSCEKDSPSTCWDFRKGAVVRLALLDAGGRTLLVTNGAATDNPHRIASQTQFDEMLAGLRFR